MSHVATLKMKFKSLDALRKAAADLGLEFREGQKTFNWYGQWMNDFDDEDAAYKNGIKPEQYGHCDHALSIPGDYGRFSDQRGRSLPYEVGVIESKEEPGTYDVVWDFYNGGNGLKAKIGEGGNALKQHYNKHVATKQAQLKAAELNRKNPAQKWITAQSYDAKENVYHAYVRQVA